MAGGESTNPSRPDRGHKTAAMLLDFENVAIPLDKVVDDVIGVTRSFMNWLVTSEYCTIAESHAFADWREYPRSKEALAKIGIICQQVDKNPGKNGADIALAMETQRIFSERAEINPLLLVTGDADFQPLLKIAQRYKKKVILASCPASLSSSLFQVAGSESTFLIAEDRQIYLAKDIEMMVLREALRAYLENYAKYGYPTARVDLFAKIPLTGEFITINQVMHHLTISSFHIFQVILKDLERQGFILMDVQEGVYNNYEIYWPNRENKFTRQILEELDRDTS